MFLQMFKYIQKSTSIHILFYIRLKLKCQRYKNCILKIYQQDLQLFHYWFFIETIITEVTQNMNN